MSVMDYRPVLNDDGRLVGIRLPAMPRFRYFQKRNGPMFSWTVEKVEGRYASFVHIPVGSGSRSGKAENWELVEESIRDHALRKDAKARALRLYQAWLDGDARPWA